MTAANAVEAMGLIAVHASPAGPVAALRGLDLVVEAGEMAAIVGPSGSGKTTLLRLLAGLERPTAGRLEVLGIPYTTASDAVLRRHRRDTTAIVEQHYRLSLSPYLPIRDSVALPLALRGADRATRDRRADELLERIGLGDRGGALPSELSGGEQQRVAVAAALSTRPRLVLADEPTGELDADTAERLLALLRELIRETGSTAVVVTHDRAVERIADRSVHLRDGRAVAERRGRDLARLDDELGWSAPPMEASTGEHGAYRRAASTDDEGQGSTPAVRLAGVSRTYGRMTSAVRALEDVSFELGRGGFHVVTGPSGAGKSTVLRLVAGLDDPTSGIVETLGAPLAALGRDARARFRAERLGIVDQGRGLTPFLSALENVALAATIHGIVGPEAGRRARVALERVGLATLADRRPATLSAGERTRVAIARALVRAPELLLLDEPTATLDRKSAAHVADLLVGLAGPRTVIAATHDQALTGVATDSYALR